ncbi:MAG: Uncharacterised protein [Halieaceae bacterium]|nr:MAG: Uncharacterised protein [Halieaceae bacterium]
MSVSLRLTVYSCAAEPALRVSAAVTAIALRLFLSKAVRSEMFTVILSGAGEINVDGHVATVPFYVK